jgi:hypothetical protein
MNRFWHLLLTLESGGALNTATYSIVQSANVVSRGYSYMANVFLHLSTWRESPNLMFYRSQPIAPFRIELVDLGAATR